MPGLCEYSSVIMSDRVHLDARAHLHVSSGKCACGLAAVQFASFSKRPAEKVSEAS